MGRKITFLLSLVMSCMWSFSQPPVEYYNVFNEGVMYWQKKPADFENAFAKFIESEKYSDRVLLVNPFRSFDEIKFSASTLKDGNRRYVRFMLNLLQVKPELGKKLNVLQQAWNMSEKIKSVNFRYEILKSLISKESNENKIQLKTLFDQLETAISTGTVTSLEKKINQILPDYKILSQQSISPEEINKALRPGEVFLSFLMTDNRRRVYVWKIEKDKPLEIIPLKLNTVDLFLRIECLKADFQNKEFYKDSLVNVFFQYEKKFPDPFGPKPPFTLEGYTVGENLKVLSETLVKPLYLVEGSKLIIAADQNISALPFDILPYKGKMLINNFDITYVPSAKVFYFLRKRTQLKKYVDYKSFIGFSFDDNGKIPDDEVNAFIGKNKSVVTKVMETNIYSNSDKIYSSDVVHFTTHGKFKANNYGTRSQYLQYYPDRLNDGMLTSEEIIKRLRFNENLVVLSACETAPSADTNEYFEAGGCLCSYGETFSNLTSAFFIAGARTLIMTQWNVKSKEANEFFEIFYEKLEEYKDVQRALRETKKDLLQPGNYGLYAPFILVSD